MKLILLLLLLIANPAYSDKVLYCHDGDTCKLLGEYGKYDVRFAGIDAPELKQAFGRESRDFLSEMIVGKDVTARCSGRSWNRKECSLFLNGADVSQVMVLNGYAWDYPKFSHGRYQAAQKNAQNHYRGLWKFPDPKSPYCTRHKNHPACINSHYEP